MNDISLMIDGPRFTAAHKAVTTALGSNADDPETNGVLWARIWENQGIELATFNGGTRVAVAYIPQARDGQRPPRPADHAATVRVTGHWNYAASSAGKDSDQLVTIEVHESTDAHLPGLDPPAGLKLTVDSSDGISTAILKGTETTHTDRDWVAYINAHQTVERSGFAGSGELFKAMGAMTKEVGDLDVTLVAPPGSVATAAHIQPYAAETLGFSFDALVSLTGAEG